MSVSVLGMPGPDPLRAGPGDRTNTPTSVRMPAPPPNLKRPWEREHSPLRGPDSSLPNQPAPQLPRSDGQGSSYTAATLSQSTHGSLLYHESSLLHQSGHESYEYPETQVGPVPAQELRHKRSRIDTSPNSVPYSPITVDQGRRVSPGHPSPVSCWLPAVGQAPRPPSGPGKHTASPGTQSPQVHMYAYSKVPPGHGPVLPSPGSATSSSGHNNPGQPPLPPSSSLLSPVSPSTTHMQNLQHELSTKALAYSNLANEHERLLAAYSRLQTRVAALDRKSKTADSELTVLQEERISLQERVETLEKEIDEIRAAKDGESEQRNRESEQWRRIIDLSGVVQKRHTEESERWKAEKESLLRRVNSLEREIGRVRLGTATSEAGGVPNEQKPGSASPPSPLGSVDRSLYAALQSEITSMRLQSEATNRQLDEYRMRMSDIDQLLSKASSLANAIRQESESQI